MLLAACVRCYSGRDAVGSLPPRAYQTPTRMPHATPSTNPTGIATWNRPSRMNGRSVPDPGSTLARAYSGMAMMENPMATADSETASPTPSPSSSERRITPYGTPVIRPLLLILAVLIAACGDDGGQRRAEQARQLARDAGLPRDVEDWLVLAAGDPGADYRVAYGELVVTQRDGERRVDAGEGGEAALAADPGPFDAAAVEDLVERLRAAKDDYRFEVEPRRLLGVTARCLVTEPERGKAPTGILCVSDEGAVLLLQGATGDLKATEYSTDVGPG